MHLLRRPLVQLPSLVQLHPATGNGTVQRYAVEAISRRTVRFPVRLLGLHAARCCADASLRDPGRGRLWQGPAVRRGRAARQDFAVSAKTSFSFSTADAYGRAAFPAVSGRTSPLLRAIVCGRLKVVSGISAPCGYLHTFTVEVPGYAEVSSTDSALPLQARGRLVRITMQSPRTP